MSFFRSEKMGYYNLVMARENAWEILNKFGEIDACHFIDQEPNLGSFQRPFANQVKRCDEITMKLEILEQELRKFNKQISNPEDYDSFLKFHNKKLQNRDKAKNTYLEEVEQFIDNKTSSLQVQLRNYEDTNVNKNSLIEQRAVLESCHKILRESSWLGNQIDIEGGAPNSGNMGSIQNQIDVGQTQMNIGNVKINCIAGVINKEDAHRFSRMAFRVTKGNIILEFRDIMPSVGAEQYRQQSALLKDDQEERKDGDYMDLEDDIIDPKQLTQLSKQVFVCFFTGGNFSFLKSKIMKLCESFGANRYDIPENAQGYQQRLDQVKNDLKDTKNLAHMTRQQISKQLDEFSNVSQSDGQCSLVIEYKLFVQKEKCLYHTMNLMKQQENIFIGSFWCPQEREEEVQQTLQQVSISNSVVGGQMQADSYPSSMNPPTYFKTNEFTWVFQEIVNTYGVPRYEEVNPALFTVITFPFLFGVMYGDMFHGTCLATFGIYLCLMSDSIKKSGGVLQAALPIRFLLLLMGLFAAYNGLIYNDFTSITINFWGSCFDAVPDENKNFQLKKDCTYAFGVDPIWYQSDQELLFLNSLKMKLSVILGVIHMSMGICMKAFNAVHFKQPLDLFFEFIPQILFMVLTFGFMDFMIFYKWTVDWNELGTNLAPNIINVLIDMPLKLGSMDGKPLWGDGEMEKSINISFLLIAIVMIPVMLLPKPIILICSQKKSHAEPKQQYINDLDDNNKNQLKEPFLDAKGEYDESQQFGQMLNKIKTDKQKDIQEEPLNEEEHGHDSSEIFVHQIIETIEFVLGSISNTASYLRLWALSLAHSQLAKVFYEKLVKHWIEEGSIPMVFVGYFVFANITFAVLMCMDVMECFLHALRLHWVEFQNKFYKADGYIFAPYSFKRRLAGGE